MKWFKTTKSQIENVQNEVEILKDEIRYVKERLEKVECSHKYEWEVENSFFRLYTASLNVICTECGHSFDEYEDYSLKDKTEIVLQHNKELKQKEIDSIDKEIKKFGGIK